MRVSEEQRRIMWGSEPSAKGLRPSRVEIVLSGTNFYVPSEGRLVDFFELI